MASLTLLLTLVSIFIISGSLASQCPTFVTQKPFDLKRYLGLWYEIYRTNMVFQVGNKCVNATYTANNDGTVGVWNQAITGSGQYTSIRGTARVKNPAEPAALAVQFDNPGAGDYNVLSTNYDQYALVYSCQTVPSTNIKFEFIWFLSRTKSLPIAVIAQLKKILLDMGADAAGLMLTLQDC